MQDVSEEQYHERYQQLLASGLIEIHPEDEGLPWYEQRVTTTDKGNEMAIDLEDHLGYEEVD